MKLDQISTLSLAVKIQNPKPDPEFESSSKNRWDITVTEHDGQDVNFYETVMETWTDNSYK